MEARAVLIIEDKPLYAASLASQFEKWGFRVQVVADHERVAAALERQKPDLLLANARLKNHVLTQVNAPILFISLTNGELPYREHPQSPHGDGPYLNFPCSVAYFKQKVETVLGCRVHELLRDDQAQPG
jgi:DNA-binding NarL/FixJ family response regulator